MDCLGIILSIMGIAHFNRHDDTGVVLIHCLRIAENYRLDRESQSPCRSVVLNINPANHSRTFNTLAIRHELRYGVKS